MDVNIILLISVLLIVILYLVGRTNKVKFFLSPEDYPSYDSYILNLTRAGLILNAKTRKTHGGEKFPYLLGKYKGFDFRIGEYYKFGRIGIVTKGIPELKIKIQETITADSEISYFLTQYKQDMLVEYTKENWKFPYKGYLCFLPYQRFLFFEDAEVVPHHTTEDMIKILDFLIGFDTYTRRREII